MHPPTQCRPPAPVMLAHPPAHHSPRVTLVLPTAPPLPPHTRLPQAKPIRTASGIAVVAVMSKPHRCPHIATTGGVRPWGVLACAVGGLPNRVVLEEQLPTLRARRLRVRIKVRVRVRGRVRVRVLHSQPAPCDSHPALGAAAAAQATSASTAPAALTPTLSTPRR